MAGVAGIDGEGDDARTRGGKGSVSVDSWSMIAAMIDQCRLT